MDGAVDDDEGPRVQLARQLDRWREGMLHPFVEEHPLRRPEFRTRSGLPVQDVFTPLDMPDDACTDLPGEYPFTRGISPTMYRSRLWTMGQYAGFGSVEDTTRRFKHIIAQGGTRFSIALYLP